MDLTIQEKTAALRAASIFVETPYTVLAEVAELLEIEEYDSGVDVFYKGDPGTCMYVIVSGRVWVHDGDMHLNYLSKGEVFGEMAVLSSEKRVATITTTEKTVLLRLDQAPFRAIMASRAEIANGVLRVLASYLRTRVRTAKEDFTYIQQMHRITNAAASLEAGVYDPSVLDEVTDRTDELGQLARVFRRMADEVVSREKQLRQQIQELRIEIDETRKAMQVSEITESEYFQKLQEQVAGIKKRRRN